MSRIAGTLLLGDGDRAPKSKAKLFGRTAPDEGEKALWKGEGVVSYLKLPRLTLRKPKDVPLPATTAEICSADDVVCDFKIGHDNTPHRVKKAFSVHTKYAHKDKRGHASSYSGLLGEAARWLARRIVAAHQPVSQPQTPAPPPVVTTPAPAPQPTVPASGPTVVYAGSTAGNPEDLAFEEFGAATGEGVSLTGTWPGELYPYRCVVLDLNMYFGPEETSGIESYLAAGGTVLALGEHEGERFSDADEAINALAHSVGATAETLDDDEYNQGPSIATLIEANPLTSGVFDLGENWVTSLTVEPPAEVLVEFEEDLSPEGEEEVEEELEPESEGPALTLPLVAVEHVGPGAFVMSGDSNMFSDDNNGAYYEDSNGTFARDICP